MFSQAELKQVEIKGHTADPSAIQLGSLVKNNHQRIRNHFDSVQTRVASGHLVLQVLSQVGYAGEPDYEDIEWACRRRLVGIGNAMRLTSVGEFGQVFNGAFIEGQDEIISLVARPIDPELSFREYTPVRYLYHEYTNLNWQLGNGKPRGVSIIEINLVELLWQYAKAEIYYRNIKEPITTPVYAWRHVISRMLPSYMDIAFLNIHRAIAAGRDVEPEQPVRTVPVPPLRDLAIRNAENIRKVLLAANPLPGVVLAHVPQFFNRPGETRTAIDRILFRDSGSTTQGSWHLSLVNWSWMHYCLSYDAGVMSKFKKELSYDLDRFMDLKVLNKLPKAIYNHYRHTLFRPLGDQIAESGK
ncbi:hypothetical protein pEaSNUABM8_00038 [Erwinia phage pEa_SNUABM_8]|nr:hypothetical protein pEaSNUABM8_00038 [Erwinia phage pEa_SNUABM_8]QVW54790.1 hypothetical protein pEaSNUABM4_00037 [Erwinia phage pEa_SNUABM_4]